MNTCRIVLRRAARRDLVGHYARLIDAAGPDTAERFLAAVDEAFNRLASHPLLGAAIGSRNLRLAKVRKWRIEGFPRVILFYAPDDGVVRIIRVLDAAQDWWAVFDIE